MNQRVLGCLAAAFLVVACSKESVPVADPVQDDGAAVAAETLAVLVEEYFERNLELNPLNATQIGDDRYDDKWANYLSPEHRAESLAMHEQFLSRLQQIDPDDLQGQDWLTYQSFRISREQAIAGYQFPSHLQPVQQFYLVPSRFVQLGSGASYHPFATVKNYDDFLGRVDDYLQINEQLIVNMKEGVKAGIVQPRVLIEKVLPQLESQLVEDSLIKKAAA